MEGLGAGHETAFHESRNSYSNSFHANETAGKVITCKAAVLWGPGEPLKMENVLVDPPQRMEVRIRILFTSVCHTDLGAWLAQGDERLHVFPRILGHEASGVVESVGEGVEDLQAGDHVIPIFNGECGDCAYCKSSKTNLCAKFRGDGFRSVMRGDGGTRFSVTNAEGKLQPVFHFLATSTFSEYTVLDSACAVKIDPKAPLNRMCLLGCCIATGVGAAWNAADVKEGSTVVVFGLGAVGLAVAQGARLRGASRIIGVDVNPDKWGKAREMGVTDFINPSDCTKPVHEMITSMTEGGVDYSFECTGNVDVIREAFMSTHDGWGLTVALGIHVMPKMLPLHPMELYAGRRIIGSMFGDVKGKSQIPSLVDKCMHGDSKINLDGFITHELPFAGVNKAFQLLTEGKSLRCLLRL